MYVRACVSLALEAYFVNIPSTFMDSVPKSTAMALPSASSLAQNMFLSYSANFAMRSANATPIGSGYHWTLQQFRFPLGGKLLEGATSTVQFDGPFPGLPEPDLQNRR